MDLSLHETLFSPVHAIQVCFYMITMNSFASLTLLKFFLNIHFFHKFKNRNLIILVSPFLNIFSNLLLGLGSCSNFLTRHSSPKWSDHSRTFQSHLWSHSPSTFFTPDCLKLSELTDPAHDSWVCAQWNDLSLPLFAWQFLVL